MDLSVFSMCLNEARFIELWLEQHLRLADEVVVIDGGSTDGTLDVLEAYRDQHPGRVIFDVLPQTGEPYSADWNTATRRQWCLDHAHGRYAFQLDIDEIASDALVAAIPEVLRACDAHRGKVLAHFNFVNLWGDWHTVRINSEGDGARWHGVQGKLWPNDGSVRFVNEFHHSYASGLRDLREIEFPHLDIYHLHYAHRAFLKYRDNRRGDLRCTDDYGGNADFHGTGLTCYTINTAPFEGALPLLLLEMGYLRRYPEEPWTT